MFYFFPRSKFGKPTPHQVTDPAYSTSALEESEIDVKLELVKYSQLLIRTT